MAIKNMSARLVDVGGVINPVTGGTGMAVDGVTVNVGDDVLLPNPPNGNGYAGEWIAAAGAWARSTDWDTVGEMEVGDNWTIREGSLYQNTVWAFEAPVSPATIDVTSLTIGMRSHRRALEEGGGIDIEGTTPPIISWNDPSELQTSFLEGLRPEYLSATSLRIKAGAAYIPLSGAVETTLDIDLAGLSLGAAGLYYVYVYDAGGVLGAEVSSQAPNTIPYRAGARSKGPDLTPDLSRRYRATVRWTGTALVPWIQYGSLTTYQTNVAVTPFRVLDDGLATSFINVDCSPVVPPTSRRAYVRLTQRAAIFFEITNSDVAGGAPIFPMTGLGKYSAPTYVTLNSVQRFQYRFNSAPAAGDGLQVEVLGYVEEV